MDKKSAVVAIVIGIILIASLGYVFISKQAASPNDAQISKDESRSQNSKQKLEQTSNDASEQPISKGLYVNYSKDLVEKTNGTKLLFFHAPWCSQCRQIEQSIKNDGIPSGVTIFKIDYDTNQKLREVYGVTLQTTFVKIDDEGNKLASYVAYEEPVFSSVERELLK